MEMTINKLPAPTWNRLGMNESRISDITIDIALKVQIKMPDAAITRESTEIDWNSLNSGMGHDMDILGASTEADSFHAAKETQEDKPVLYRLRYQDNHNYYNKVQIYAEENSETSYIFTTANESGCAGLSALQVKVYARKGAKVRLYFAQLLDKSYDVLHDVGGYCEEDASVEIVHISLGGNQVYAGGLIDLQGQKSSMDAKIGYLGRDDQHIDMNYVARHQGAKTESNMEVLGILRDQAFKLFRGTIDFLHGSSGAVGNEKEDVLLIGDDVVNQTIPLILCAEEDVEGNHGATIGKLDESMLFYLGSRGISKEEAERIIAKAKIDALCSLIPDEDVRKEVEAYHDGL